MITSPNVSPKPMKRNVGPKPENTVDFMLVLYFEGRTMDSPVSPQLFLVKTPRPSQAVSRVVRSSTEALLFLITDLEKKVRGKRPAATRKGVCAQRIENFAQYQAGK